MAKSKGKDSRGSTNSAKSEITNAAASAAARLAKEEAERRAKAAHEAAVLKATEMAARMKTMSRLYKLKLFLSISVILLVLMCMVGSGIFLNDIATATTSAAATSSLESSPCGSSTSSSQAALYFMLHLYSFLFCIVVIICELGNLKVPLAVRIFKEFHVLKSWVTRGLLQSFIGISTASLFVPGESGASTIFNQVFGWWLFAWGLIYAMMRLFCVKQYLENDEKGVYDTDNEEGENKEEYAAMEEGAAGVEMVEKPAPSAPPAPVAAASETAAAPLTGSKSKKSLNN